MSNGGDEEMSEILSYTEIQKQYKSEWVLIEDPETEEDLRIKGGKVLWHSKDRDELYRKAREMKPKHSAIVYTGEVPRDTVIVL